MSNEDNVSDVINRSDEDGIGCIVAALIREHIEFDVTYASSGLIVIAVEHSDEAELNQIFRTTR